MRVRRPRLAIQLFCIALLLFAQQAAFAHAIWHAHQQLPAGHQQRADTRDAQGSTQREASAICTLDAVLGEVLGAAPCGSHVAQVLPGTHAVTNAEHAVAGVSRFLAPLSRGPPSLR